MRRCSLLMILMLTVTICKMDLRAGEPTLDGSYIPGRVIFKLASEYEANLHKEPTVYLGINHIDRFLSQIYTERVERTFPDCLPPLAGGSDLTRIYTIYFPDTFSAEYVSDNLIKTAGIEYAESWYIYRQCLDHNDPRRDEQYGLDLCQANEAHDISTGDRRVPIAIIDSGVDMDHEDLVGNLWVNPGEDLNRDGVIQNNEINRRDDDDNGRIDDFHGWDFFRNDNDPDDRNGHGTHCAGVASAVTNNRTGVASVGYSCGIMAVRAGDQGVITHGYPGIEYAARTGAKVINCSWGNNQYSQVAQDVVNYAYEHDALVIAAAGNQSSDDLYFPAGYDNVIAVVATDPEDRKVNVSNYGEWIDICAPGDEILSTRPRDRYQVMTGTSMASAFASSVAILIRAAFGWMSVDQAGQCLLDGAQDIDGVNDNRYRGLLGEGRINAFRSLQLGRRPVLSIDHIDIVQDDNHNGRLDPGERADMTVQITNDPQAIRAERIEVALICENPDVEVLNGPLEFPALEPGEMYVNLENPFFVQISDDAIAQTTEFKVMVNAEPEEIEISRDFEVIIGHPNILIVDDDGGDESEIYYFEAVEAMDQGWVRWNVQTDFSPEVDVLTDYEMVIWITGNSERPLNGNDLWQLEEGLFNGANILLIGNHIGDDEANRQLLIDCFGARHDDDSVNITYSCIIGLPGNRPISEDANLELDWDDGADYGNISPSSMTPVNGADSLLLYYDEFAEEIGGVAAVYHRIERSGAKAVHFGFAFEGVGSRDTPRHEILDQLYQWFISDVDSISLIEVNIVNRYQLDPPFPNPSNGIFNINFYLPLDTDYYLKMFDISGREIATIYQGFGVNGRNHAVWNSVDIPSGIYFARLHVPGRSPLGKKFVLIK